MKMVTYEIHKLQEDNRDTVYFTSYSFDCVMRDLWEKHKYETGCTLVIKIPNVVDEYEK
jgi:hypothetical protein